MLISPNQSNDWPYLTPFYTLPVTYSLYLKRKMCHLTDIQIILHSNSISHFLIDFSVGVLTLQTNSLSLHRIENLEPSQ